MKCVLTSPGMMKRATLVLLCLALASPAWADDDDDLVPLAPTKSKPKVKAKPKAKAKPRAKAKAQPVDEDDDLVPLAPVAARGNLNVKPPAGLKGAVLTIDGREVGVLPLPEQPLPAGEHTVTVKRPGYAAFVKKVVVASGKTVEVEAKLIAVAAVLTVTSDVPGAQVLVNGRVIGVAPLSSVEVPPGPVELEVVKEGYAENSQKLTFVAGRDYPLLVKLNSAASAVPVSDAPVQRDLTPELRENPITGVTAAPEPVTSKWYFWVGVGVAVAAAVAIPTIVYATDPANQPLTSTQVCGGRTCDGVINFDNGVSF